MSLLWAKVAEKAYHGTDPSNRDSIHQNGLTPHKVPQEGQAGDWSHATFFSPDPDEAREHGADVWETDLDGVEHDKVDGPNGYHYITPHSVPPSRLRLRSSKDDNLSDRVSKMPENIAVTKAGFAGRVHPYKHGLMDTGFIQPENYDDGEDHDIARKKYEPVDDTPDLYKFVRATPHAAHIWDKIKPSKVDLTQPIHATQPFVHKTHIQRYLDNPGDKIHDDKQPGQKVADDYPFKEHPGFVKYRGRMHVIDGHHRVGSELMKGSPSITGKVYDADKHGLPTIKAPTHDGWGDEDPGPPR